MTGVEGSVFTTIEAVDAAGKKPQSGMEYCGFQRYGGDG